MVSALALETSDGFNIFVENRRMSISRYTFLELDTWFEPEAEFVRLFLKPGMRVIDIGANCGYYSLLAARRVEDRGKVWAFEPGLVASRLLQESVAANRFENITLHKAAAGRKRGEIWFTDAADNELSKVTAPGSEGGRPVPMEALDALYADSDLQNIDFIKIDAEEHEAEVIAGGTEFFVRENPVVMIEVSESHGPSRLLEAMGYARYRFCNSIGCLVPFTGNRAGEKNFNLFLCKPERAEALREAGLLVRQPDLIQDYPPADPDLFIKKFLSLSLMQTCPELEQLTAADRTPQVTAYYSAMAELLLSEDPARPKAERAVRLSRAETFVDGAFNDVSSLPELFSYCRIWRNTGRSQMCSNTLRLVIENRSHPQFSSIGLPFLPVLSEWDGIGARDGGFPVWLEAMMMAGFEVTHGFSSAFDGIATIQAYCVLRTSGLAEEWLERRAVLKALLVASEDLPAPLFIGGDMKYNRAIWHRLAAHIGGGGREFPDLPQAVELS